MKKLVLASASLYRKELLRKLGLDFITCPAEIDETAQEFETADQLAVRLAVEKAKSVAVRFAEHLIIASDQVAMHQGQQLTKPGSKDAAIDQLNRQSGHAVAFHTGLCLLDGASGRCTTALDRCTVYFKRLSADQIRRYVELEKPYDCAGSFKSEGLGIALFERIEGDDPNALVGLPLIKLVSLLEQFGVRVL